MNTRKLLVIQLRCISGVRGKGRRYLEAHLKGMRSFSRSREISEPYHGQTIHICEENEMKEMSRVVPPTLGRTNQLIAMIPS
jgi:hypothetical protein